jgi:putative RNA 2'-phosphotransferase
MEKISKIMSFWLRHSPEKGGLTLDKEGYVSTESLLNALSKEGYPITHNQLDEVVETNDKKRFTYNSDKKKIRAAQGHSIKVDIKMKEKVPPTLLFHGTKEQFLLSIKKNGLVKGNRNHVHLSANLDTAHKVANRRNGKSVIIAIFAKKMAEDGYKFFISDNGVWLIDHVPSNYLDFKQF